MNQSPTFIVWWKEVRSVLPLWGVAVFAMLVSTVAPERAIDISPSTLCLFAFTLGSLVTSAHLFTRECSDRTLIWQLTMPQARMAPFWRKCCVAAGLQLLLTALFLMVIPRPQSLPANDPYLFCAITSLVAIASATLWGLVLRQTAGAVVMALTSAAFLMLGTYSFLEWSANELGGQWAQALGKPHVQMWLMSCLWVLLALASGIAAMIVWHRLQLKGDAAVISGIEIGVMAQFFSARTFARRPVWFALITKELGLLRHCFWLAALVVAAAGVFIIADLWLEQRISAAIRGTTHPEPLLWWQGVLRGVGMGIFVLAMVITPLMCGALAFAEERHLGNHAWQLCQPVSALRRWFNKIGTVAAVSVILGLLLPATLAWIHASLRNGEPMDSALAPGALPQVLTAHFLLFSLSAWAGSWSQNTISAIMKTFVALIAYVVLHAQMAGLHTPRYYSTIADHPVTAWTVTGLALVVVALFATLINHRMLLVPPRNWLTQSAVLVSAVVIAFYTGMVDN
ncbi:MAG TPA: hypothetical protein DCY13_13120 [Verrucomicrobiales bacterium]|nr:hypothetical protein [Verrucomicrobiales bacterium]